LAVTTGMTTMGRIPDGDQIGDTPYRFPLGGGQDGYPLMVPFALSRPAREHCCLSKGRHGSLYNNFQSRCSGNVETFCLFVEFRGLSIR